MQQKTKKWLSLVLAVLLVSACFTGTLLVRAAQDVAIDETHFPDAASVKSWQRSAIKTATVFSLILSAAASPV